jgi:hypothetical protein
MNPKTLKTIFSKIAKDKTNLSKAKLQLSAIDRLNNNAEEIERITQELMNNFLRNNYDEFANYLSFTQDAAAEFVSEYNRINTLVGELNSLNVGLENAVIEYRDLADELGIDPEQNQDYNDAESRLRESQNAADDLAIETNNLASEYDRAQDFE